ncbi:LptE family protein [Aureibaculum sp. 2210JD6-5]|uniref:LptE family protein n=1 Tax=Aureibaculum sp. 2210JD6-5 TaxID=3103957 RepID=UPI002AAC594A|nr:LptE family protein [Aureibaculum sp. 2210JD6-5]MDY7395342.1 LptE family protein [Aureibaculum sp. 2210JD6-5]
MKKIILAFTLLLLTTQSCGIYSFTGGSTGDAETIQIDYFPNNAILVEPSVSQKFTEALRDLFTSQTNLSLTTAGGDLHFEGEITDYKVIPITATADQRAAQNRLTITVRVRFYNKLVEEDNFEKTFSFYSDFGADQQLTGGVLETALEEIFERLTQDIYNASVAKW